MRITHVIPYMHPAAGGPPVVADRLCRELATRGHEIRILTTDLLSGPDRTWANGSPRPYEMSVFPNVGGNRYAFSMALWRALRESIPQSDVVHIHTLWTFASLAAARASVAADRPFLIMPHGMLDPHSVERGWLKKQGYGRLLEWPLLRRAYAVCYTHPEEERLAGITCRNLPRGHIVELGADSPPECSRTVLRSEFLERYPELAGREVAVFLSRVHPKKGLDLLIPAFDLVRRRRTQAHLLIVGTGEQADLQSLRSDVAKRGLGAHVTITGALYGRRKWAALAASDLFVLPSYQENFALAAVEALRSGLPVILSRRVNLWQDIVDAGAGRDCDLEVNDLAETLHNCLGDLRWRETAAEAGERLLARRFNWAVTAERLEMIYENARSLR